MRPTNTTAPRRSRLQESEREGGHPFRFPSTQAPRRSRLKEPSTHAGIAAALAAVAPVTGPASTFVIAAAGVFGALAVAMREGSAQDGSKPQTGDR
jgi:hypothetical protein